MIRKFSIDDLPFIFNILWENYEEITGNKKENLMKISERIWGKEYYFLSIENLRKADYEIYVYELNGEIIGFISFKDRGDYIYLDEIHVKRNFRRKGIGSKLINCLKSFKKPIVAEAHEKSLNFFLRHGFRVLYSFKGYGGLLWYKIKWEPDL